MQRLNDSLDIPYAYEVVGEHLWDTFQLLVQADDGCYYALDLTDGHIEPTSLADHWIVDVRDVVEALYNAYRN